MELNVTQVCGYKNNTVDLTNNSDELWMLFEEQML